MNDISDGRRVDLNLFRVFAAVYRGGGITVAAAQLHLSQPAVSNALTRLRLHFGDALFVRDGRRMSPTPRARQIAPQVEAALDTLQAVTRSEQRFEPATAQRRYQIGLRDMLEFMLLPELLHEVLKQAPGVSLQSRTIERRRLERMLAAGGLDLAIDVPLPLAESILHQPLLRDHLCTVLRQDHPLARRRLTLDAWLALPHVVVSARPTGAVLEDVLLQPQNLQRRIALRCQHYSAACRVVAETNSTLLLPQRYAERFASAFNLRIKAPPLPLRPLELQLYWHRNAANDSGLRWLRQQITGLFSS